MAKEFNCLREFYEKAITKEELKDCIIDAALELGLNWVDKSHDEIASAGVVFEPLAYLNMILDNVHDGLVTKTESGVYTPVT